MPGMTFGMWGKTFGMRGKETVYTIGARRNKN